MKVNVGERCSGKTTKMLIKASKDYYSIVITPSFNRMKVLEYIAEENNLKNIRVTTFDRFLSSRGEYMGHHLNIYIDDLDDCLNKLFLDSGKRIFEIKEVNFCNENENENERMIDEQDNDLEYINIFKPTLSFSKCKNKSTIFPTSEGGLSIEGLNKMVNDEIINETQERFNEYVEPDGKKGFPIEYPNPKKKDENNE